MFVRDFVPSGLAFLMNGEPEIVRNFLIKALMLQAREKRIDHFVLGEGVMPASFKVLHDPIRNTDTMIPDFGESAIGRVAPVDSGFWWIILLRAYTKSTGDHTLADTADCQRGMRLILDLCLSDGFDTFPTLLCADGCAMIDRRMVYTLPLQKNASTGHSSILVRFCCPGFQTMSMSSVSFGCRVFLCDVVGSLSMSLTYGIALDSVVDGREFMDTL